MRKHEDTKKEKKQLMIRMVLFQSGLGPTVVYSIQFSLFVYPIFTN